MADRIPVVKNLFAETPAGPRLTGSRCGGCGAGYLPKSQVCHNPECDGAKTQDAEFGPSGTVWSLAIQDYPPPPPVKFDQPYKPFAMGFIDLDDGLRILGRIETEDPRSVEPGARVELIIDALAHDEDGNEIIGWKFKPV